VAGLITPRRADFESGRGYPAGLCSLSTCAGFLVSRALHLVVVGPSGEGLAGSGNPTLSGFPRLQSCVFVVRRRVGRDSPGPVITLCGSPFSRALISSFSEECRGPSELVWAASAAARDPKRCGEARVRPERKR